MTKYNFDLHFHSCLSPCGSEDMTPAVIAGFCALYNIKIAALTDHNTAKNCKTFLEAAKCYNILGVPGMELTTSEEIHVVVLFKKLEDALDFSNLVSEHLPPIKNKKDIFGEQLIKDVHDQTITEEDAFLSGATDISIYELNKFLSEYDCLAFPAHIDRPSFSLMSTLGMWDETLGFEIAELSRNADLKEYSQILSKNNINIIVNSDAHYLDQIMDAHQSIELNDLNIDEFFDKLLKQHLNMLK